MSGKKILAMLRGKATLSAAITKILSEASNCPPVDFGDRDTAISKIEWPAVEDIKVDRIPEDYLSVFTVSERDQALIDKVAWYYKSTPDEMNNRDALPYSRALHKWVSDGGYTREEFSRAKKNYWMMKDKES